MTHIRIRADVDGYILEAKQAEKQNPNVDHNQRLEDLAFELERLELYDSFNDVPAR